MSYNPKIATDKRRRKGQEEIVVIWHGIKLTESDLRFLERQEELQERLAQLFVIPWSMAGDMHGETS